MIYCCHDKCRADNHVVPEACAYSQNHGYTASLSCDKSQNHFLLPIKPPRASHLPAKSNPTTATITHLVALAREELKNIKILIENQVHFH